jgi:hypothetical protein
VEGKKREKGSKFNIRLFFEFRYLDLFGFSVQDFLYSVSSVVHFYQCDPGLSAFCLPCHNACRVRGKIEPVKSSS